MCRVLSSRNLTWTKENRTKLAKSELQKAWADSQLPPYINKNIAMRRGNSHGRDAGGCTSATPEQQQQGTPPELH